MSEFVSLYLRANISEEKLMKFLQSPIKNVPDFKDWLSWLESGERMYGNPRSLIENFPVKLSGDVESNLSTLDIKYHYDEAEQIVIFYSLHIDENFNSILPPVAALRDISNYIEPDTSNNFLVVYPYWWGSRETVNDLATLYMNLEYNRSILEDDPIKDNIQYATAFYDKHGEVLAKEFYEKNGYF